MAKKRKRKKPGKQNSRNSTKRKLADRKNNEKGKHLPILGIIMAIFTLVFCFLSYVSIKNNESTDSCMGFAMGASLGMALTMLAWGQPAEAIIKVIVAIGRAFSLSTGDRLEQDGCENSEESEQNLGVTNNS